MPNESYERSGKYPENQIAIFTGIKQRQKKMGLQVLDTPTNPNF